MPNVKCILTEQGGKGGGGSDFTILSIEVTQTPKKTKYYDGDEFNSEGMTVTAHYGIKGTSAVISSAEVTSFQCSPKNVTMSTKEITITYTELGSSCTATTQVTVVHKLQSLSCTNPTTSTYEYGDTLNTQGVTVTAHYSDSQQTDVTQQAKFSPTQLNTVGQQAIEVSYTQNEDQLEDVTQTTTFNVAVNRKKITKPTWKGPLTYNGGSQSANNPALWNDYNQTYMTIGGVTSGVEAQSYTAIFTLTPNYSWAPDGDIQNAEVDWSIGKKTGSLTLEPSTISFSQGTTTQSVTLNKDGSTGAVTCTRVDGITSATANDTTLTVVADGVTALSGAKLTVSMAADKNHTDATAELTVNATYWEWGDESADGDATWWAGLQASVKAGKVEGLQGKKKVVTLSQAVLGSTKAQVICIGTNIDGTNTATFQTAGTLYNNTTFSGSSALWKGSNAEKECNNFYNYCSAKDSIKEIGMKYCTICDSSRNHQSDQTYQVHCFLPSECQMGLNSYSSAKDEWTVGGANTAYPYYSNNNARKKCQMNATTGIPTTSAQYYWERSRYYNNSSYVCIVGSDGSAGSNYYYNSRGLAPAFVIG